MGVPGRDLYITQVDAGVEHGRDEGVPQHVWVHPREPDASLARELTPPPGGGMPVHADAAPVQQRRAGRSVGRCPVNGAADRGWQRNEEDSAALAAHAQEAVPVFLAQVVDVCADGLEDPQPEKAEQAHKREVVRVARLPCGGEHGLELQVRQAERGRLRWNGRSSDVLGRGMLQDPVDDAGPVSPPRPKVVATQWTA